MPIDAIDAGRWCMKLAISRPEQWTSSSMISPTPTASADPSVGTLLNVPAPATSVSEADGPRLSVVTATLNSAALLPRLIASLQRQTDQDFEWVVADGDSTDDTLQIARSSGLTNVQVDSRRDFGIYDALNRAIRLATGDYYLVLGSDDELYPDAIASFKLDLRRAGMPFPDIVAAAVEMEGSLYRPLSAPAWRRSGNAFIGNHAVGTAFRRDLHLRFGYYSHRFVNSADMLFVRSVMAAPGARLVVGDFTAGHFALVGISSSDRVSTLTDVFRVQLMFERNKWLQLGVYVWRLIRTLRHMPPAGK